MKPPESPGSPYNLPPLDLIAWLDARQAEGWFAETETAAPAPPKAAHAARPSTGMAVMTGDRGESTARESYARSALDLEIEAVRSAPPGGRNNQLNRSSLALYSLVAAGALDEGTVERELTAAAMSIGLDPSEIGPTIASGRAKGMSSPRDLSDVGTMDHDVRIPSWEELRYPTPARQATGTTGNHIAVAAPAMPAIEGEVIDADDLAKHAACPPGMEDNPHRLARIYANSRRHADGPILRYWREDFHLWDGRAYRVIPSKEVRAELTTAIEAEFSKIHNQSVMAFAMAQGRAAAGGGGDGDKPAKPPKKIPVTTRIVGDVLQALGGIALLRTSDCPEQPAWLGLDPLALAWAWPVCEVLPTRNALVHLPSVLDGNQAIKKPTPTFFSPYALDYDFDPDATSPTEWISFLGRLWPDDPNSIATLQEWMGYMLTHDTSQQKIMMLIGPPRSGKGTIARIITALIGPDNVANPTLTSLATNFGLTPLVGKLAAIVGDARISGRTDSVAVVERLLSISGEDPQTIDRKHTAAITTRLLCRFMILSNEPPKLKDASGAIVSRLILLQMTESFYGREDRGLYPRLLAEMPGILLWAIDGWRRLRERGHFIQPDSSADLLSSMKDLGSPVAAFVEENCDLGMFYHVEIPEIYARWRSWCQSRGRENVSDEQNFGRDMHAVVPGLRTKRLGSDGSRVRAWTGLRLKEISPTAQPEVQTWDLT